MAEAQFPSNSNKGKSFNQPPASSDSSRPKMTPIIVEGAIERKKPLGARIRENFTGDDAHSVGHYILFDILLPSAKAMIVDAIKEGAERLIMGGGSRRSSSIGGDPRNYVPYNRFSSAKTIVTTNQGVLSKPPSTPVDDEFDPRQVIIPQRGDAEMIMDTLRGLIEKYDYAKVTDLKDLISITGNFVDEKWGWSDLSHARIRPVREGFLLDLPAPEPLN